MTKRDLIWLLGIPVFLILGTIRHEGAHALVAWMQGAAVAEFVFLPGFWEGQFYFGYVLLEGGNPTWLTTAAPYLFDLLTFAIFFVVCGFVRFKRHWLWLVLVILGLISLVSWMRSSSSIFDASAVRSRCRDARSARR